MNEHEKAVLHAALLWWEARRPATWTEADHLRIPLHRAYGCIEQQLADAVATHIRATKVEV